MKPLTFYSTTELFHLDRVNLVLVQFIPYSGNSLFSVSENGILFYSYCLDSNIENPFFPVELPQIFCPSVCIQAHEHIFGREEKKNRDGEKNLSEMLDKRNKWMMIMKEKLTGLLKSLGEQGIEKQVKDR